MATAPALQRALDELEIRNLIARIPVLTDTRRERDEYIACFAEDAVWECVLREGEATPGEHLGSRLVGREAILKDRARIREKRVQGPDVNSFHFNSNLIVSFDSADQATAESYWLFLRSDEGEAWRVSSVGYYHDRLIRTKDGWKLRHRRFSMGKPAGGHFSV
jgi:hypothetical protein